MKHWPTVRTQATPDPVFWFLSSSHKILHNPSLPYSYTVIIEWPTFAVRDYKNNIFKDVASYLAVIVTVCFFKITHSLQIIRIV